MFLVQNRQPSFYSTRTYFHLSTNVACNPVSSSNTWCHPKIGLSIEADTVESCRTVVEIVAWVLILIWLISPITAVQIMKIVETRLTTVHKINNVRMVTTITANKPQGENVNIPEDWLHVLHKGYLRDICFASCMTYVSFGASHVGWVSGYSSHPDKVALWALYLPVLCGYCIFYIRVRV